MAEEKLVGRVTHYFGKVEVGVIELSDVLKVGDTIHIKGKSADFTQPVSSMRIDTTVVNEAKIGDHVGIKVLQKVRENDSVFKV
jgi:U32 family peptidase